MYVPVILPGLDQAKLLYCGHPVRDTSEDGVFPIEPGGRGEGDEELGAVGVGAGVGLCVCVCVYIYVCVCMRKADI
jgi:hypothetical protein